MEQNAERESLLLHLGCLPRPDDLVFANGEGKPIAPGVLSHDFASIANCRPYVSKSHSTYKIELFC
jgi:hypothetical protein